MLRRKQKQLVIAQLILLLSCLVFSDIRAQNEFEKQEVNDLRKQIEDLSIDQLFNQELVAATDLQEQQGEKFEESLEQVEAELVEEAGSADQTTIKPLKNEIVTMVQEDTNQKCNLKEKLTINNFNNKYFWKRPQCDFSDVQTGLEELKGRLMAIGFLNNDPRPQKLDLVTVNDKMNSFRVHLFNTSHMDSFINHKWHKVDGDDSYISSIQIAKDQSKLRSLIITYWKSKPVTGTEDTFVKVFKQVKLGEFESKPEASPKLNGLKLQGNIQPFWLDINGDMLNDFIFQDNVDGSKSRIRVALGQSKDSSEYEFRDFSSFLISSQEDENCLDAEHDDLISQPHSNSYVDLNQDCIPDIFLTRIDQQTKELYYEIYLQKIVDKKQRYCLVKTKQKLTRSDFPKKKTDLTKIPLIFFTDIDRDSQTDMIFYYEGHLFTFFNQLKAKSFDSKDINTQQNLCHEIGTSTISSKSTIFADIDKLTVEQLEKGGDRYVQIQDLKTILKNQKLEILDIANPLSDEPFSTSSKNQMNQGRIRLEDLDQNGYPDILISLLVKNESDPKKQFYYTTILTNHANADCKNTGKKTECRQHFIESDHYKGVREIVNKDSSSSTSLLVPIDVDENGRFDFLSQYVSEAGTSSNSFKLIYNNFHHAQEDQFFFLKMMILYDHTKKKKSDAELADELKQNIGQIQDEIYGDIISGATLRFVASDLEYEQYVRVGQQQNQMTYNSFMMPYIYIGVSQTSNYFESLSVGHSIRGESKVYTNTPIIPKSQLILYASDEETYNWSFIMFTDPGKKMYAILMCCGVVLILLGIMILVKYYEEKREDEKMRPIFNFDYF